MHWTLQKSIFSQIAPDIARGERIFSRWAQKHSPKLFIGHENLNFWDFESFIDTMYSLLPSFMTNVEEKNLGSMD